jgi:formamidopyrimidine-DNA glycosylase
MPELPEVEVLVRQLNAILPKRTIRRLQVRRRRVLGKTSPRKLAAALKDATFSSVGRRGKFLLFNLSAPDKQPLQLLGHLGMTGRMYLSVRDSPLPKHAAVVLDLGDSNFVFEDTRYFGKLTLDLTPLDHLGPEPLDPLFTTEVFAVRLRKSSQPIKIKLLDQSVVAGVGNIYASEALFRARISPLLPARQLTAEQIKRLRDAIRQVLKQAIKFGGTVPLTYAGGNQKNDLFYYGSNGDPASYDERLLVYDREGRPCTRCRNSIHRIFQAGRSTFYCTRCQPAI